MTTKSFSSPERAIQALFDELAALRHEVFGANDAQRAVLAGLIKRLDLNGAINKAEFAEYVSGYSGVFENLSAKFEDHRPRLQAAAEEIRALVTQLQDTADPTPPNLVVIDGGRD